MGATLKQVDKDTYTFQRYTKQDRWASYYYQIREILACDVTSVLEIGAGEGILRNYLRTHSTIAYRLLDIANDLDPDVLGSITAIPFAHSAFDIVCAFEVLEHIPFEQLGPALSELSRVAKRRVIISIFHSAQPVKVLLKIPFLPEVRFLWKAPNPRMHKFDGQHYWEIGKRDYSHRRVRHLIRKHFMIYREFIPFDTPYYHFYILDKLQVAQCNGMECNSWLRG